MRADRTDDTRPAGTPRRERGWLIWLVLVASVVGERIASLFAARRHWPVGFRRAFVLLWLAGGLVALGDPLSIPILKTSPDHSVEVVQTTPDLVQRMTHLKDMRFVASHPRGIPIIHVNDARRYQQVRGFGAAMTDSSAWLLYDELPPGSRNRTIRALFGPAGIHLNFLRIPMGASDYTRDARPYSYDDMPRGQSDPGLQHFSIAHDVPYIIPSLREVLSVNPHLQTLANLWSPPGWMKTNDSLDNRANSGILLNSAYGAWARYFVKFIHEYARHGIPIDAITPQNEPGNPTRYPGMNLDSATEAKLILGYLRPTLRDARLDPHLYEGDIGWDSPSIGLIEDVAGHARAVLQGAAEHCYAGAPDVMSSVHRAFPRLEQIVDECTTGLVPEPPSEMVISSMRHSATVVATWNLALDPEGGPVQPPNHGCPACTGLVTVDEHTHTVSPNPGFFEFGQASAFVQAGARRIDSEHFVSYHYDKQSRAWVSPGLDDIAYVNPDGSRVVLAYNSASTPIRFGVEWHHQTFTYSLPPQATVTFIWDRPS